MPTVARSRKHHERTGRVDWARVDATTDKDIARQIAEDPDTAPELTEEALDRAMIVSPDGTRVPYRRRVPRASDLLKPGEEAPQSGQYEVTGPRGRGTGEERTSCAASPCLRRPRPGSVIGSSTRPDRGASRLTAFQAQRPGL
jgi:hypothetical protein